jgi:hypothetical protein
VCRIGHYSLSLVSRLFILGIFSCSFSVLVLDMFNLPWHTTIKQQEGINNERLRFRLIINITEQQNSKQHRMMAASMKGNKRKSTTKAPVPRAPPRRSARIENKLMWDRFRNTKDVMRHVYSFLSVYDRVHVAEVDRTFRDDEDRGRTVGSYGDAELDLLKAFEMIKKWHDFEISPDYSMHAIVKNFYTEGGWFNISAEWYTLEGRWDVERIMVRSTMFFLLQQGRVPDDQTLTHDSFLSFCLIE